MSDKPRNFGVPSGQVTERGPLTPDLFMKIGTRVGTITAFYEHVNNHTNPTLPSISNVPKPVVRVPTVQITTSLEQTVPLPDTPIYDTPRSITHNP